MNVIDFGQRMPKKKLVPEPFHFDYQWFMGKSTVDADSSRTPGFASGREYSRYLPSQCKCILSLVFCIFDVLSTCSLRLLRELVSL